MTLDVPAGCCRQQQKQKSHAENLSLNIVSAMTVNSLVSFTHAVIHSCRLSHNTYLQAIVKYLLQVGDMLPATTEDFHLSMFYIMMKTKIFKGNVEPFILTFNLMFHYWHMPQKRLTVDRQTNQLQCADVLK